MIKVERVIHKGWEEFDKLKTNGIRQMFGKYQYIFSNDKGQKISLIELPDYFADGTTFWEIYQLEGETLFEDIDRFTTSKKAKAKCVALLK